MVRKKCLLFIEMTILFLSLEIISNNSDKNIDNKVLIEYDNYGSIGICNDLSDLKEEDIFKTTSYSMQILLNFDWINDSLYEENKRNKETLINFSKRYHTKNNLEYLKQLNTSDVDVFVSQYTPYIFSNYNKEDVIENIYTYAVKLSKFNFIENIRIFPSNIYDLDINALDETSDKSLQNVSNNNDNDVNYENYPIDTPYLGEGIKIGVLDTGIFDTSHSNFSDIYVENVYDTYTKNDNSSSAKHPMWVSSILGGKYGYAPKASIYYVDVNSETGFVGIERLLNKDCNIINMSISATTSDNYGVYDTGLEGYIDYIYNSTKVIMVASAGNSLNKEGEGGYLNVPALCANVISVGSVDENGIPSDFSSYKVKNNVTSNPNLVAVGNYRKISGFNIYKDGTSFSAPAITGAIAQYFSKVGIKDLPSVLSALTVTSNNHNIDKETKKVIKEIDGFPSNNYIICTNTKKNNGLYERTGAGLLDVKALLDYPDNFIKMDLNLKNTNMIPLTSLHLEEGETIRISLVWQRNATVTNKKFLWFNTKKIYSSDDLADIDLYLQNSDNGTVAYSTCRTSNVEYIEYKVVEAGTYRINVRGVSNYIDTHNINFAYSIN